MKKLRKTRLYKIWCQFHSHLMIKHDISYDDMSGLKKKFIYFTMLIRFFFFLIAHPILLRKNSVVYEYMELPVTTNCTLRCKHCATLTQYYHPTPFTSSEDMCGDLRKLLEHVDFIMTFRVLGGEPLLYPHLNDVIETLASSGKIWSIHIVTNGTIAPRDELISIIKLHNVIVDLSNYGELSKKIDVWKDLHDITVNIMMFPWYDHGPLKKRNRSDEELIAQHSVCPYPCYSYFKGKLFRCARASSGWGLGIIPLLDGEYVEVRNGANRDKIRSDLQNIRNIKYAAACDYCYVGTDAMTSVPMAEQADKVLEI